MHYIACFGDSLIQGFPFGNRASWVAAVEAQGQIKMLNYGLCGDCCDDIFERMEYIACIIFGNKELRKMFSFVSKISAENSVCN